MYILLHNQVENSLISENVLLSMLSLKFREVVFIRSGSIFQLNMMLIFISIPQRIQIEVPGIKVMKENLY